MGGRVGSFEDGTVPELVLVAELPVAVELLTETPYWLSSATEKEEQRVIANATANFIFVVIVGLR